MRAHCGVTKVLSLLLPMLVKVAMMKGFWGQYLVSDGTVGIGREPYLALFTSPG